MLFFVDWLGGFLIMFTGVCVIIVLVDFFCLVFIVFNLWILVGFYWLLVYLRLRAVWFWMLATL